jgi:lipopolysaccharide transport protein LptA
MTRGGVASATRSHTGGWQVQGPRGFERPLYLARRHSRLVRRLRWAVPTAAIFGVAVLAMSSVVSRINIPKLPRVVGIHGTRLTMEVPHIGGFTRDGREYKVSAEAAVQDLLKPEVLELSGIKGTTITKDNQTVKLSGVAGLYETKSQLLTLTNGIDITTSDGKHAQLIEAQIETAKGNIVSNKPVKVQFPNGDLRSDGVEIFNNGEMMHFFGSVVLNTVGRAPATPAPDSKVSKAVPPTQHDAPVRITSASLEMRDKDHLATFKGDVIAVQQDSTLKCDTLVVDYEGGLGEPATSGEPGKQIRHLNGKGHVILTKMDQVATGNAISFDAKSNTATLLGNVSVTQGQNVVRGDKLVVDLTTGEARVDMVNNPQGRVQSTFYSQGDQQPAAGAPKARSAKPATSAPLALSTPKPAISAPLALSTH